MIRSHLREVPRVLRWVETESGRGCARPGGGDDGGLVSDDGDGVSV